MNKLLSTFINFLSILGWILWFWLVTFFAWIYIPDTNATMSGTGCTFFPTAVYWNTSVWTKVTCHDSELGFLDFWTGYTIGWSFSTNTSLTSFTTTNYWMVGYIYFTGCSWVSQSNQTSTGTCSTYKTIISTWSFLRSWPKGATWSQWPQWPVWNTWATWIQGIPWLDAYEIAQIMWFSGSIDEWLLSLKWATWSIDFSSFTGAIQLNNIVDTWLDPVEFDTGSKIPIIYNDWQGNYFISEEWSLRLVLNILLGILCSYSLIKIFIYFYNKGYGKKTS